MPKYQALISYCQSESQRNTINAVIKEGSHSKAAKALKIDRRVVDRTMKRVEDYAASQGYAPAHDMIHPAPDGFIVKGTSTLYDEDGNPKIQWVKTNQSAAANLETIREACENIFGDVSPLPKVAAPKKLLSDLAVVYPMGDPHLGLYAWAKEAGQDFDTDIAAKDLMTATDRLVDIAPAATVGILLNLGDFFHGDNMDNTTKRGTVVDVDTRWPRVLDIGLQTMIRLIRRMLEKHKTVIVRNNIGNHDTHTSIMLAIALRAFFHDNKRVEIDTSPNPFWFYRHGKVLIGSTHGDRTKPADLPQIMAEDRAADWGQTIHRHWYTGHVHHQSKHEFRGCTVESFRTLAAKDAWHNGQGYRSGRDMRCIILHKELGQVESHRVGIEQLR